MSYSNPRIKLHMTSKDIFIAMSENNPGALTACCELYTRSVDIDPDAFAGGLSPLLSLDTMDIYGSRLYQVWNDICDRDIVKTVALIRSYQLGITSIENINAAIEDSYSHTLDLDDILSKVMERLPNFNQCEVTPEDKTDGK